MADAELGGVEVPAGSTLVLAWTAANRDADAFPHPDDIDLERPNPRQHVGFGWGIHLCVGAPLARVEAKVAFEQTPRPDDIVRPIDPSSPPLRHHLSLMIRRLTTLPLVLERAREDAGATSTSNPQRSTPGVGALPDRPSARAGGAPARARPITAHLRTQYRTTHRTFTEVRRSAAPSAVMILLARLSR